MNKESKLIAEAYQGILKKKFGQKTDDKECNCEDKSECGCDEELHEAKTKAKKKLSPAQKKIAAAAPPPDEITGADFKALKAKKKLNEDEQLNLKYDKGLNHYPTVEKLTVAFAALKDVDRSAGHSGSVTAFFIELLHKASQSDPKINELVRQMTGKGEPVNK